MLYGSETWTMRKRDIRRLEAFEMWTWRRIEKISWTEHKTNKEVLGKIGEERDFIHTIKKKTKDWAHAERRLAFKNGQSVIEGIMEGRRKEEDQDR